MIRSGQLFQQCAHVCTKDARDLEQFDDIKTAFAVKAGLPISSAGRSRLLPALRAEQKHTHHALDDARGQAEIFAKIMGWEGYGR